MELIGAFMRKSRIAILIGYFVIGSYTPSVIAADLVEYNCAFLATTRSDESSKAPIKLSVAPLASSEPVDFPPGVTPATHQVSCARSMLVPTLNDLKILSAGYTFFLGSAGEGNEPRMAVFVDTVPHVHLLMISGTQTWAEKRITERVLKKINSVQSN
jgi:hypothetical protein